MTFKEFPDIGVKLKFNSTNPYYIHNLAINRYPPHDSFAHAIAMPVELTGRFLGGTIRSYVDCYRYLDENGKKELKEDECLDLMLTDMFPNEWFHAALLDEKDSNKTIDLLHKEREVREFLEKGSRERVIFIPGERYAKDTWGFDYTLNELGRMSSFRLPPETMPEFIDVVEGLSTVIAIMRTGETCSLIYLNSLFRRMSDPRFKPFLEDFVKRKHRESISPNRKTLERYMEKYYFEISNDGN